MSLTPGQAERLLQYIIHQKPNGREDQADVSASHPSSLVVDTCDLLATFPEETLALFQQFEHNVRNLEETLSKVSMHSLPILRFAHVPPCLGVSRRSLTDIGHACIGQFVTVVGLVTRLGAVKAAERSRTYACSSCGSHAIVHFNLEQREFEKPQACRTCRCEQFVIARRGQLKDYQEIRIQEPSHGNGVTPRTLCVVVMDDFVSCCSPGDTIVVGGLVRARWQQVVLGMRLELDLIIEANHARVLGDPETRARTSTEDFARFWLEMRSRPGMDDFQVRRALVEAVAPCLHGMQVPKLALLLVLIGSPSSPPPKVPMPTEEDRWGNFVVGSVSAFATAKDEHDAAARAPGMRTTPHFLLAGGPGMGKSRLLQAAAELSERPVITSGVGATRAGLTCTCLRDGGSWALEAGALALADGGVCCIDEFGEIDKEDQAALHEAMEQQTISIAKPGLISSLKSRCSIVAAQNLAKTLDPGRSLSECTRLPPPLLSRFDLILVLKDNRSRSALPSSTTNPQSEEARIADMILNLSPLAEVCCSKDFARGSNLGLAHRLKGFVSSARQSNLKKQPSPSALEVLERYYAHLRSNKQASAEVVTVRTFESLMRLSQAHARLLQHDAVQLEDVVAIVLLHQVCFCSQAVAIEKQLLSEFMWGASAPAHLRSMGLDADLSTRMDYEIAESVILSALGLRKDLQSGKVSSRRSVASNVQAVALRGFGSQTNASSVRLPDTLSWVPYRATAFEQPQRANALEDASQTANRSPVTCLSRKRKHFAGGLDDDDDEWSPGRSLRKGLAASAATLSNEPNLPQLGWASPQISQSRYRKWA